MPQVPINQALWLEEVGSEEVADIQTHLIHPAWLSDDGTNPLQYLCWNHKLVCATSCFWNVFFVLIIVLGLTVILASVVSSLTYEKDCVRCFFNSLLWVWSCHAAWALPHSITKVKQPVYFGASPSDWEIKCVSMRMKGQRNVYMGTICSCGTDAFEVSVFLRAGVWVYI